MGKWLAQVAAGGTRNVSAFMSTSNRTVFTSTSCVYVLLYVLAIVMFLSGMCIFNRCGCYIRVQGGTVRILYVVVSTVVLIIVASIGFRWLDLSPSIFEIS